MTEPAVHVVRPYSSEEEYLEAEAWTIDARGMLLVDQPELPVGAIIQFDVSLATGNKVMRGEARVAAYLAPTEDRVGAVQIRFRKYAQQTKAFIDRALAARELQLAELASEPAPAPDVEPAVHSSELVAGSGANPEPPPAAAAAEPTPEPMAVTTTATAAQLEPAPADVCRPAYADPVEPSGIHRRPTPFAPPVPAPENREELLARLRARAQRKRSEERVRLEEEQRRSQSS